MRNEFSRSELIFGREGMAALWASRVAVFGVGGVGGGAVEALARGGVGAIDLVDDDRVCLTNINRQIIAAHSTVGRLKVDAAEERSRALGPEIAVRRHACFFLPETADALNFSQYDYVIDAIDTVKGKLEIILRARAAGVPVISCMGAGNKTDPTMLRVADIYETKVCPLARVMRAELRKRGVEGLTVVYSEEPPKRPRAEAACGADCVCPPDAPRTCAARRSIPGSASFVPPVAGMIAAGVVIRSLASRGAEAAQAAALRPKAAP
jgi:tRNA A37 threonylcarbamoyladenosine dehydratase